MMKKTFLSISVLLIGINLISNLSLGMEQPESITIITNDGVQHEARRDICMHSKTIKHCLRDLGGNEVHLPLLDSHAWLLAYETLQQFENQDPTLGELFDWLFRNKIKSWKDRFSLATSIDYLNNELFNCMWYIITHPNHFIG